MMAYHRKRRSRRRSYDYGHEAARRHIEDAHRLSVELGGMDEEVKTFFFALPSHQLDWLLKKYAAKYGAEAGSYAVATYHKWKSGSTHMSGLVAGRLFNLLPPIMPMDLKLRIVEALWERQGASRTDYVFVPKQLSSADIVNVVTERYFGYIGSQTIPQTLKSRFDWLSGEDAKVAEQLFRHARSVQLRVKEQVMKAILAVVEQAQTANSDVITATAATITVGNHHVSVKRSDEVQELTSVSAFQFSSGKLKSSSTGSGNGWIWFVVAAVVLAILFLR